MFQCNFLLLYSNIYRQMGKSWIHLCCFQWSFKLHLEPVWTLTSDRESSLMSLRALDITLNWRYSWMKLYKVKRSFFFLLHGNHFLLIKLRKWLKLGLFFFFFFHNFVFNFNPKLRERGLNSWVTEDAKILIYLFIITRWYFVFKISIVTVCTYLQWSTLKSDAAQALGVVTLHWRQSLIAAVAINIHLALTTMLWLATFNIKKKV